MSLQHGPLINCTLTNKQKWWKDFGDCWEVILYVAKDALNRIYLKLTSS